MNARAQTPTLYHLVLHFCSVLFLPDRLYMEYIYIYIYGLSFSLGQKKTAGARSSSSSSAPARGQRATAGGISGIYTILSLADMRACIDFDYRTVGIPAEAYRRKEEGEELHVRTELFSSFSELLHHHRYMTYRLHHLQFSASCCCRTAGKNSPSVYSILSLYGILSISIFLFCRTSIYGIPATSNIRR